MRAFIFIDESGSFNEGVAHMHDGRPSLVGGTCSTLSSEKWRTELSKHVYQINQTSQHQFNFPRDFHCTELFQSLPLETAKLFSQSVLDCVSESSIFCFCSKNTGKLFEYSKQTTYVLHLVAAARLALQKLSESPGNWDGVEIYVGQRTINDTCDDRTGREARDYMVNYLCPFLEAQLLSGEAEGAVLARRLASCGTFKVLSSDGQNSGLMAADFVCNRCYNGIRPDRWFETTPSTTLDGENQRALLRQAKQSLVSGQYAIAFEFAQSLLPIADREKLWHRLFKAIEEESKCHLLERGLPGMLAEARHLISVRTKSEGALKAAAELLTKLVEIGNRRLVSSPDPMVRCVWARWLTNAFVDLASCYNHMGETTKQVEIMAGLDKHLTDHGREINSSFTARKEILLDLQIRNLNQFFNDYDFQKVLANCEDLLKEREQEVPKGQVDIMLGEMLGSMGQACSFLAGTDPTWGEVAKDYLQRSLAQFSPGTAQHAMSVNFLSSLDWQTCHYTAALSRLRLHANLNVPASPEQLASNLSTYASPQTTDVFIAVLYVKIVAAHADEQGAISKTALSKATADWAEIPINEHPHELLLKWLGYLHYRVGDLPQAFDLWRKAHTICDNMQFTGQTIGLSILALETSAHACCAREADFKQCLKKVGLRAEQLCDQSMAFSKYLQQFGGPQGLRKLVSSRDQETLKRIVRLLPFTYC